MANIPIWKDQPTTNAVNGRFDIGVAVSGGGAGIAHTGRTASAEHLVLNDIAEPYLAQKFPTSAPTSYVDMYTGSALVDVRTGDPMNPTILETNTYFLDWSYDDTRTMASRKSDPITGRFDARQVIICTKSDPNVTAAKIYGYRDDGTGGKVTIKTTSTSAVYSYNYIIDMMATAHLSYRQIWFEDGANAVHYDRIARAGRGYVPNLCSRYVLYYVNAFGGWDSIVMEGNCKYFEDYTPADFIASRLNPTANAANVVRYRNEVARRWSLNTGLLTEAEAAKMYHLLGSRMVYLVDFGEGYVGAASLAHAIPVNITNSGYERYLYKADGVKSYTIEVTAAATHNR